MGLATENVARKYEVSREEQDRFAALSHRRAAAAQDAGRFDDEIVPLEVTSEELNEKGKKTTRETTFDKDEGVRRDTSEEGLAKLRPAFHAAGTITAGNASQMSDGAAAAVIVSEERARLLGVRPMARFVAYATAGCPPEEMGIGPVYAIPKALKLAGLRLEDIDVIELNEAFAAQSLAVIKTLGLDPERTNVNGGAIALGHPLGCTGAKLTATALRELERRGGRYAMITMCVGGGMGAAGIFERIQ
jgi:acetyl-CoA acyltransferase